MRRKNLVEKLGVSQDMLNLSEWPIVDIKALDEVAAEKYQNRKRAVELYLQDHGTISEISEVTGIEKKEITRYVERCFRSNQFGETLGFRALIPGLHLKDYERRHLPKIKALNYSGAFELLLEKFTDLPHWIAEKALAKKKNSTSFTYSVKYLHKHFIEECKKQRINMDEYPLNTEDQGRRSLERYVKKLKERHFGNEHLYGEVAAMMARTVGKGEKNYLTNFRPFSRVMFDGHKIDLILTIRYTDPNGNQVKKALKRIWLLVILEIPTNAVLGHLLCVKPEYSQMDVLQCIQNATHPHTPMSFTIKGLQYPEEGSFPSISIPETQWAVWREFWMDNARANLALNVKEKLTKTIGCFINAGPIKSPLRRSVIERFFRILEVNGYHLLPSTTGSNPSDPKRKNAEEKALASEISIEHLEELTEAMLAQYNVEPHSGNSGLSPIKAMKDKIERGFLPRVLPEHRRKELGLLVISQTVTVQGNLKKGKRPYINFEGAQYRNEILSQHASLIGKKLTIYINIMDIRYVRAFLENGSELGQLRVSGKWVKTPHSLETRRYINKFLRSEKRAFFLASNDYVQALRAHLSTSKNKGDKNWLAHMDRYQQKMENMEQDAAVDVEAEDTEVPEIRSYQEESTFSNTSVFKREEAVIDEHDDSWDEFFKPMSF
jgi:putative transposase